MLCTWASELAGELQSLGVRVFPTETYFFLADFDPHDATVLAGRLKEYGILTKPLDDAELGPSFMRVTTSMPADNERVVQALKELL